MSLTVYKVQSVLNSYLKQLKANERLKDDEDGRMPADVVTISSEAKKRLTMNKMGEDAVKSLHEWALKPFMEEELESSEDVV